MKRTVLIHLIILLCSTLSWSQFLGGNGDGFSADSFNGLLDGSKFTVLYSGGNGDGFSEDSFNGLLDGSMLTVLYSGGNGDGFSEDSFNGLLDGSTLTVLYFGGNGDGFSEDSFNGLLDGSTLTVLYSGGNGDGFSEDSFNGLLDGSSLTILFMGGNGDGFAADMFAEAVLPIELLYFGATLINDSIELKWVTASEINNDFFTVEKTRDGENIEQVCTVEGKGNSFQLSEYYENDNNPYKGLSYYRLKQTDFDGATSNSSWVSIINNKDRMDIILYPNPSYGNLANITISGMDEDIETVIEIYTLNGKLMYNEKINPEKGRINFKTKLSPASYVIKIKLNNSVVSKKLIVN